MCKFSLSLFATVLMVGCTNLATNAFRVEQTATDLAYTAYQGWTNGPMQKASPAASNEVRQARLKFAATLNTVDDLRVRVGTNTTLAPLLSAAIETLPNEASNLVWLVNLHKQ